MNQIFEAIMLICFGAAWPFSIIKSIRSGSAKGKSLLFLLIIDIGYLSGIIHKFFWSNNAVIYLYIMNFILVSTDIILYLRNRRRDLAGQ